MAQLPEDTVQKHTALQVTGDPRTRSQRAQLLRRAQCSNALGDDKELLLGTKNKQPLWLCD